MRSWAAFSSPIGPYAVAVEEGAVVAFTFGPLPPAVDPSDDPLLAAVAAQVAAYFARQRRAFSLPLRPAGTPFQQEVWAALQRIPYGATTTYSALAAQIGRPRAVRAVGQANGDNPIGLLIPCHRVIGASGALTGDAAATRQPFFAVTGVTPIVFCFWLSLLALASTAPPPSPTLPTTGSRL